MYSTTLSLTSALDGGGWSTPRPGLFALPIVKEAGWALDSVRTCAEDTASNWESMPRWYSSYRMHVPTTLSRPTIIRKVKNLIFTFDDLISELNKN